MAQVGSLHILPWNLTWNLKNRAFGKGDEPNLETIILRWTMFNKFDVQLNTTNISTLVFQVFLLRFFVFWVDFFWGNPNTSKTQRTVWKPRDFFRDARRSLHPKPMILMRKFIYRLYKWVYQPRWLTGFGWTDDDIPFVRSSPVALNFGKLFLDQSIGGVGIQGSLH